MGAVCLLALLALSWWLGGASPLLNREFWMDEVHTWLLVSDPDVDHAMDALADGVDFNPPTYFLTARLLHHLPGGLTEFKLRLLSLGFMLVAVIATYLFLTRTFSPLASLAAMIPVASHAAVLDQSTEARFYAMWAASITCMALCLPSTHRRQTSAASPGRRQNACRLICDWTLPALLAAVVATVHYFGIISVALVLAGFCVQHRFRRWSVLYALVPGSSALVALACCQPFLSGQRSALSRPTWITAPTALSSLQYLIAVLPVMIIAGLAMAAVIVWQVSRTDSKERRVSWPLVTGIRSQLSLLSVALMPFAIVGISWLLQPAMVVRYAMVGVFGCSVIFAWLLSSLSPRLQLAALAVFLLVSISETSNATSRWQVANDEQAAILQQVRRLPESAVVVFEDRILWLPTQHAASDEMPQPLLIDFTDNQMAVDSSLRAIQRDVGKRICHWYPEHSMRSLASLADVNTFYVVPYAGGASDDLHYPGGFVAKRIDDNVFLFQREDRAISADFRSRR